MNFKSARQFLLFSALASTLILIHNLILSLTGLGTPIRRGLGGISLLKWSPTGDYFFAAKLYCKLPDISSFICTSLAYKHEHSVIIRQHSEWRSFNAVMGHFICGRQTHGHQKLGPQEMDLSRLVNKLFFVLGELTFLKLYCVVLYFLASRIFNVFIGVLYSCG